MPQPAGSSGIALGIDAATPPASVAVVGGGRLLAARSGPFGRDTDAWILPAIEEVLQEAGVRTGDLACIGVTVGPGTFTGIRVGMSTAMGLTRGARLPLRGVTTLQAIALGAVPHGAARVLATVDARRGQIYAAIHDVVDGVVASVREPWLAYPAEIATAARAFAASVAAGTGLAPPELASLPAAPAPREPLAAAVARLALGQDGGAAAPLTPFYLRGDDAQPPRRRARTP